MYQASIDLEQRCESFWLLPSAVATANRLPVFNSDALPAVTGIQTWLSDLAHYFTRGFS